MPSWGALRPSKFHDTNFSDRPRCDRTGHTPVTVVFLILRRVRRALRSAARNMLRF